MALLDDIRTKIATRQYEYSKHAVDQTIVRNISVGELEEAISNRSEVIEDYPEDKYGPSCLSLGSQTIADHYMCSAAIQADR
jgi:hypothetical protein